MGKFKTKLEKKKEKNEIVRNVGLVTQLGILMTASVLVGIFMGIGLDKLFKTNPWFTIIFSIFGIIASFKNMFLYTTKR